MTTVDDRLRAQLRAHAAGVPISGVPLGEVQERGRRRRRRARIGTAAAMTVAVLGGATAAALWFDAANDEPSSVDVAVGSPEGAATPASGQFSVAPSEFPLQFRAFDAVDRLSQFSTIVTDGEQFYALSTAPGAADNADEPAPQAVYRSSDGVSWTPQPVGDTMRLSDLAAHGGRLYAVGTAPSTASVDTSQPVAAWSDDGGATWETAPLPLDLAALGVTGAGLWIGDIRVEAAPAGVVALATVYANVDAAPLLPEGTDLTYGFSFDQTGLTIYGRPNADDPAVMGQVSASLCDPTSQFDLPSMTCLTPEGEVVADYSAEPPELLGGYSVASTHTWDELGVPATIGDYIDGRTLAFHSADGTSFAGVATLDQLPPGSMIELVGDDGGFLAIAQGVALSGVSGTDTGPPPPATTIWRSPDGITWTPEALDQGIGLDWTLASGTLGQGVAVVGAGPAGPVFAASPDGSAWTTTDLKSLLGDGAGRELSLEAADISPRGALLVVREQIDPVAEQGGVDIPLDSGHTLRLLDATYGRAVLLDPAGAEVVAIDSIWERAEPQAVPVATSDVSMSDSAIIRDANGNEIVSVPYSTIEEAYSQAWETEGGGLGPAHLLWTNDGQTWSETPLGGFLPDVTGLVTSVAVGDSSVQVQVADTVSPPEVEPPEIVNRVLIAPTPA